MLGRELPPIGRAEDLPFRDTDQRVMGFVVRRSGEEGLVGRDEAQFAAVGELQKLPFQAALLREPVALQLHIDGVPAEQVYQPVEARRGGVGSIEAEDPVDGAVGAAGQDEDAGGAADQAVERDVRGIARRGIEVGLGPEPHEMGVAVFRRGQQHDRTAGLPRPVASEQRAVTEIDRQLDPDDRLDPLLGEFLREFQRSEEVVGIRDGECRHAVRRGKLAELRDGQRAFAQRKRAMHVKVNEAGSLIQHSHVQPFSKPGTVRRAVP